MIGKNYEKTNTLLIVIIVKKIAYNFYKLKYE